MNNACKMMSFTNQEISIIMEKALNVTFALKAK